MKYPPLGVLVCALLSAPAVAQTPPEQPGPTTSEPLGIAELAGLSAKQGETNITVMSDQDLTAISNGNSVTADSINSGQITLDRGAFEGFAGVGNFVINSGHNNNLQGALTINIVTP